MNLLFCRSFEAAREAEEEKKEEKREGEHTDFVEVTLMRRPDSTILSPYVLPSSPTCPSSSPSQHINSTPSSQDLTTLRFFGGEGRGWLRLLGVIFDTKGSDSFEFVGKLYVHTSVVRVVSIEGMDVTAERGERQRWRREGQEGMCSYFDHSFDCKPSKGGSAGGGGEREGKELRSLHRSPSQGPREETREEISHEREQGRDASHITNEP